MTRKAWLKARDGEPGQWTIGGSDVATILGWSNFSDPIDLYGRKLGLTERDDTDSEPAQAGRFLEDGILDWYAKRTGRLVVRPAEVVRKFREQEWKSLECDMRGDYVDPVHRMADQLLRGPEWYDAEELSGPLEVHYGPDEDGQVIFRSRAEPWRLLTPDAFVLDPEKGWGIVDAKNLHGRKAEDWAGGVPPDKSPQVAHYTQPTPFTWGGFAVVFGGQSLKVFDMAREDMGPIFDLIDDEVREFIRCLDAREQPRAEPSAKSLRALKRLYPEPTTGKMVGWVSDYTMADGSTYDPEEFDLRWLDVKKRIRTAHDEDNQLQAVIREVAKDAEFVAMRGGIRYRIATTENGRQSIRRSDR